MKKFKYKIKLSDQQKNQLNIILASNRKNLDKHRASVILLRYEGYSAKAISNITKLSERTIKYYIKGYALSGHNAYMNDSKYKKSKLDRYNSNIEEFFKENKPKTYTEASQIIKDNYGFTMSDSWIRKYLNRHHIYSECNRLKK